MCIVRILLWSIVKFIKLYNGVLYVSTGWYILIYSYLDFRASRLKGTRIESTLMGMFINIPRSFDINVVCSKKLCKH